MLRVFTRISCHAVTSAIMSRFAAILSTLGGVRSNSRADTQPYEFHRYIGNKQPFVSVQTGPLALQLPEVLGQVLALLDSTTLCTTVPLVCKQWHQAVQSPFLWVPRIDPQLLAVATQHAGHKSNTAAAAAAAARGEGWATACRAGTYSSLQERNARRVSDVSTTAAALAAACSPASCRVSLALLHHAVYARNLLRNPTFLSSQNASQRSSKARAVITPDQRKLAWVTTVGDPSPSMWQCPPVGLAPGTPWPPPPLPYPTYRGGLGLSEQLQGWIRGLASAAVSAGSSTTAGAAAAGAGSDTGLGCLTTGSSWGEVVQVVDLVEELTLRGLREQLAAALLDHAGLALGLSIWVAAPEQQQPQQQSVPATSTSSSPNQAAPGRRQLLSDAERGMSAAAGAEGGAAANAPPPELAPPARAARVGAAAHAQFAVALMLDDGQVPLRSFQTFVRRDSSHHFFSKRLAVAPGGWRRYAYLLPAIPASCRRAVVLIRGRGPYPGQQHTGTGAKFANAQLSFVKQADIEEFGAEACLTAWADKRVTGP